MIERLVIPRPDDFHAHLRQGPALRAYARRHASSFGRALVMPNILPPPVSGESLRAYRAQILAALQDEAATQGDAHARAGIKNVEMVEIKKPVQSAVFEPLMAFKLLPGMSAATVFECASAGSIAGKYYPVGATTNSADGLRSPEEAEEALEAMEEAGLVLCIHAEAPEAPLLEREAAFLPTIERILTKRPRLKIVVEHLSTREGLEFVLRGPARLAGSITAHHLALCLDDLAGEVFDPWLYCKPILKGRAERDALRQAVFGSSSARDAARDATRDAAIDQASDAATGAAPGVTAKAAAPRSSDRLFFGSDSAPHTRAAKEGRRAAAGIYSSPVAVCLLATLFDEAGALDALRDFLCARGAAFYGLEPAKGSLCLRRESWTVPEEIDGAAPLWAGGRLAWKLDSD